MVACTVLCLLFPVAAPLFFSLFVGVSVREAGLEDFANLIDLPLRATFFLGLTLGVLCEASTLLDPTVLKLLLLGILALTISALGGIAGGYVMLFATGGKFQPDDRHRRRELRSDDGQGGAEDRNGGQSRGDHPAAGPRRQHQRGHHLGHHRRCFHLDAALTEVGGLEDEPAGRYSVAAKKQAL